MDIHDISKSLAGKAEDVCRVLLPQGKLAGAEWEAGSINGEAGKSLKVKVRGDKSGIWSDFQTGDSGDLIDLWRLTRQLPLTEAVREAKKYLGIADPLFINKRKEYRKPEPPKGIRSVTAGKGRVMEYLTGERKLTAESLAVYKVAQVETAMGKQGPWMVFGSIKSGSTRAVKYLHVDRVEGKKQTMVEPGCEPTCYGWHTIPESAREIVICEGELDAITLYQYGYPAVSVPFGGGGGNKQQWVDSDWDILEVMDTIYLCMDADEAGKQATVELIKRLGEHRCKIVELPAKDANECLQAGISKAAIDHCFATAKTLDPAGLKTPLEFEQQVLDAFFPVDDTPTGLSFPWHKFKLRLRPGELTVWTGWSGHRKSMVLGQLMVHAASYSEPSMICSFEMKPASTFQRMVRQATAKGRPTHSDVSEALQWMTERIWVYDKFGSASVEEVLKVATYAHKRYGIKHLVIDSLMRLGLAEDDLTGQAKTIQAIVDFALTTGVHCHLVAHARKRNGGQDFESTPPEKHDIRGSQQIGDNAFNIIIVHKNVGKERALEEHRESGKLPSGVASIEDIESAADMTITCAKSREQEDGEGRVKLMFDWRSMQGVEPGQSPIIYSNDAPF